MPDPQPPMTPWALFKALDSYTLENSRHTELERRHLAAACIELKEMAYDLGSNGVTTYREKNRMTLAQMRLDEIFSMRQRLHEQDAALEDEAKKLTAAK